MPAFLGAYLITISADDILDPLQVVRHSGVDAGPHLGAGAGAERHQAHQVVAAPYLHHHRPTRVALAGVLAPDKLVADHAVNLILHSVGLAVIVRPQWDLHLHQVLWGVAVTQVAPAGNDGISAAVGEGSVRQTGGTHSAAEADGLGQLQDGDVVRVQVGIILFVVPDLLDGHALDTDIIYVVVTVPNGDAVDCFSRYLSAVRGGDDMFRRHDGTTAAISTLVGLSEYQHRPRELPSARLLAPHDSRSLVGDATFTRSCRTSGSTSCRRLSGRVRS